MNDSRGYEERVAACEARTSTSPSHAEELRSAVLSELRDWQDGMVLSPGILLSAVERYDEAEEETWS
ncbi:MAG: hypothetical protein WKF96_23090 [Solirubrobacteraceae bacterium]